MTHRLSSDVDQVHLFTMRELNQDTARTIEEINRTGKPGVITRHGRFVAVIYPLANKPVESRAIARALEDVEIRNQLIGESAVSGIFTSQEAVGEFNVTADVEGADRELNRRSGRR